MKNQVGDDAVQMAVILKDGHYQFSSNASSGPTAETSGQGSNCSFSSVLQLLKHHGQEGRLKDLIAKAKNTGFDHPDLGILDAFSQGRDLGVSSKTDGKPAWHVNRPSKEAPTAPSINASSEEDRGFTL